MSTYAIGDIQGCAQSFSQLLRHIDFHPSRDKLWLVGDLVNRGPNSAQVLRDVMLLGRAAQVVLGNHDLHALSVALQVTSLRPGDTLAELLSAPEWPQQMAWLRQQPLLVRQGSWGMLHAGLWPQWTSAQAQTMAQQVSTQLAGSVQSARAFLQELQRPGAQHWDEAAPAREKVLAAARALVYLRACDAQGIANAAYKGPAKLLPPGLYPWFAAPGRRNTDVTWVCGHWSALGLHLAHNVRALDTGCVWGRNLTALRLEDETLHAVAALEPAAEGHD